VQPRPSTPEDALAELLAGNERFVTNTRVHPHQDAERRAALANGQRPFAVLFGCSDSRLSAEIIFDRGLGDLFVVRTAGHIVGAEVLATIEYGVTVLKAPLVVVLGHDGCGAIETAHAAMAGDGRVLSPISDRVMPSLEAASSRDITDDDGISRVHIQHTVDLLCRPGSAVAEALAAHRCLVVGMSYRLAEGRVSVCCHGPVAG
jgi:carbonic anhydrase